MFKNYQALSEALHLTSEYTNANVHEALKNWCYDNISRDIYFEGEPEKQYKKYDELARFYLDRFLPVISQNTSASITLLDDLTPIQYAAMHGYDRFLENLDSIPKEAWDLKNKFGMTPLHLSAVKGYIHTVATLLEKGANPEVENRNGQLPIYSALQVPIRHDPDLLEKKQTIFQMLKAKAPESILHQDRGGDSILHLIAANGFSDLFVVDKSELIPLVFRENNYHVYPVHKAVLNQQTQLVELLLNIDKVASLTDAQGRVPLHYAASYGTSEIAEIACDKSPEIDVLDEYNNTPLILAGQTGNLEAIEVLIKKGADPDLTDYEGYSVLHRAILGGHYSAVRWLLENTSVDINKITDDGKTPLSLSEEKHDFTNIKNLLLQNGAKNSSASGLSR